LTHCDRTGSREAENAQVLENCMDRRMDTPGSGPHARGQTRDVRARPRSCSQVALAARATWPLAGIAYTIFLFEKLHKDMQLYRGGHGE